MTSENQNPDLTDYTQAWFDERAQMHAQSDFYRVQDVVDGEVRLYDHEIQEVGDVTSKRLIQLQCHIGLEAVGWARLGAETSGLDFSGASIEEAKRIAAASGVSVDYTVSDIYKAPETVGRDAFDIAYVNGGSLHWLPDLRAWGSAVNRILKPGGMLYLNLFHPVSLVLAENQPTFERDYFDSSVTLWDEPGSYVDPDAKTDKNKHAVWDRPVSDIVMAVIENGMEVNLFRERPGQEFQQFPYQEQRDDGRWYNPAGMGVHPSTFSLRAIKRAAVS